MATPEELGCDERSSEMVRSLPIEQQELALDKLRQAIEASKVRNASAYIVGVCREPELLLLDEGALKLLQELPLEGRKVVISKFKKQAGEVRNPSAWVAKSVLKFKQEGGLNSMGMGMGMGMGMQATVGGYMVQPQAPPPRPAAGGGGFGFNSLDDGAQNLLRSLPKSTQQEILGKLMMQPHVSNPSAWVAKAAMSAGATNSAPPPPQPQLQPYGGGVQYAAAGMGAEDPYDDFDPQVAVMLSPFMLDNGARGLLKSLPVDVQIDISGKLATQPDIKNPSGWVVKAAMSAGAKGQSTRPASAPSQVPRARPSMVGMGGMGGCGGGFHYAAAPPPSFAAVAPASAMPATLTGQVLDEGARELLGSLPMHVQQELLNKLSMASPKNPSGWMVKAAMSAGAKRSFGGGGGFGTGVAPAGAGAGGLPPSLPAGCQVDIKAQELLASLRPDAQREIIEKLTNSWTAGSVKNPSAWVAKAALKAGATSTPGMGGLNAQGAPGVRFSPY